MKRFVRDNSGISLIELVIVITIMTVLIGAIGLGVGLVSTKPATQCAKKLQMAIQKTRTDTMGKRDGKLIVKLESDGSVSMTEILNAGLSSERIDGPVTVGKKGVSVKAGGNALTETGFTIEFTRSEGKLRACSTHYSSLTEGTKYDALPIVITKGSKSYEINIDELTGRVTLQML